MANEAQANPVLLRETVVAELRARLEQRISAARLAAWAFDQFYRVESEEQEYEAGYEDMLADVLDALMFSDEPGFALDEEGLRTMITRLQVP